MLLHLSFTNQEMDTAQDPSPTERMAKAIIDYFKAEKNGALLTIAWALLATLAAWLAQAKGEGPLFKGMAPPLLALALLQLAAGAVVFFRSDKQRAGLLSKLGNSPKLVRAEEQARMEKVMANFDKIKMAEQLLLLLGFAFLIGGVFFGLGEYMVGTGVGLSVQCAYSLVFDLFAAMRAGFYVHELGVFEKNSGA
jgi:hypothetical protein